MDNRVVPIPGGETYANYMEYLGDAYANRGPWSVLQTLRARNPDTTYQIRLHFDELNTGDGVLFSNHGELRDWAEGPSNFGGGSDEMREILFDPNSAHDLDVEIVRVPGAVFPGQPQFRAAGGRRKLWGYLGRHVTNCVVRQMADRVAYYTVDGTKRPHMHTRLGMPKPTSRDQPGYDAEAMRKLSNDKTYKAVREGFEAYLASRDLDASEDFGFEPRDLSELAELCSCRIVVFVTSHRYRTVRYDTDDHVQCKDRAKWAARYVFCFNMTCDQHLEILPPETMRDEYGKCGPKPGKHPLIELWSDADFDQALLREGSKPEDERRLYLVRKRHIPSRFCPPCAGCEGHRHAGTVLQSGERFFKHECLRDWTQELLDDGQLTQEQAALATSLYDVHHVRLAKVYRDRNVRPVRQRDSPSLYTAVAQADKVVGHMQLLMREGDEMYEYDGRRWYLTDFSKAADFPYFHGVPVSDTWNEYVSCGKQAVYDRAGGGFTDTDIMIGNSPGDEPFTFGRDKYAVFQVESLDLGGCDRRVLDHLQRDRLFTEFDPESSVMYLPSPVLHLLQDQGAVWRASRLWICYGCWDTWTPDCQAGRALRKEMDEHKTYPMVLGKLMCGRSALSDLSYVAPDLQTAQSLQYWYSSQFYHGRLCTDRDHPQIVYEGEEHEYETRNVVRPHTDPSSLIHSSEGEFVGATNPYRSVVVNGYLTQPRTRPGEECNTYSVTAYEDKYGWATTMCHVSGAQHAYAFARLYQAVLRVDPADVVGYSLDAFRTRVDVTSLLDGLVTEEALPGTFKPAQLRPYRGAYKLERGLLSDQYTPRHYTLGLAARDQAAPAWNAYKDGLARVSIITGPAGSGKTTRHLQKMGAGREDYRLPATAAFVTMTNHLAQHVRSTMGVKAYTNFKGFNRNPMDGEAALCARERFDPSKAKRGGEAASVQLRGTHSVLLDEVSMIDPKLIYDAIEVCKEQHMQLLIAGDFDRERFFQLGPVKQPRESFWEVLRRAEISLGMRPRWIEPMRVFRQTGDPRFSALLGDLRALDGLQAWDRLRGSDLFRHVSYEEMLREMDPERDLVAHPWHRIIGQLTEDYVTDHAGGEQQLIKLRGNFRTPRKLKPSDHEVLQRLKMNEEDEIVYKGSVCHVTKAELYDLMENSSHMPGGLYSPTDSQAVNPMIGATVFNLQGLSMPEDGTLYVLNTTGPRALEWCSEDQPKAVYVAASRARRRDRLVVVHGSPKRKTPDA